VEVGYDPGFGACPLKRAIQRELQDALALKILSGDFHEGDILRVDRGKDGLVFSTAVRGKKWRCRKKELGGTQRAKQISEFFLN